MKYTYHKDGTVFSFDPRGQAQYENTNNKPVNALEFHKELVKLYNCPSVYILDNKGNPVEV